MREIPYPPISIDDMPRWHSCMIAALSSPEDRKRFDIYSSGHFRGKEDEGEFLTAFIDWATAFKYLGGLSDPLTWRDENGVLLSEGGGPEVASAEDSAVLKKHIARMDDLLDKLRR